MPLHGEIHETAPHEREPAGDDEDARPVAGRRAPAGVRWPGASHRGRGSRRSARHQRAGRCRRPRSGRRTGAGSDAAATRGSANATAASANTLKKVAFSMENARTRKSSSPSSAVRKSTPRSSLQPAGRGFGETLGVVWGGPEAERAFASGSATGCRGAAL